MSLKETAYKAGRRVVNYRLGYIVRILDSGVNVGDEYEAELRRIAGQAFDDVTFYEVEKMRVKMMDVVEETQIWYFEDVIDFKEYSKVAKIVKSLYDICNGLNLMEGGIE